MTAKANRQTPLWLLAVAVLTVGLTFLGKLLPNVTATAPRVLLNCLLYALLFLPAFFAFRAAGGKLRSELTFGDARSYLWGLAIFVLLGVTVVVIPLLCGVNLIGEAMKFDPAVLGSYIVFTLLFVGPVEEFLFRIYLQDTLLSLFSRCRWLAPILSAAAFGLWHLILGDWLQAAFTFLIGLLFGFARYKLPGCSWLALALGHGLYDLFIIVMKMFAL